MCVRDRMYIPLYTSASQSEAVCVREEEKFVCTNLPLSDSSCSGRWVTSLRGGKI